MEKASTSDRNPPKRWSSWAFLLAGGLLFGHAVIMALRAFTDVATPTDVFAPTGHLVALVGVVGLYPMLRSRTPTLTRIGTGVTGFVAIGWVVITLSILARVVWGVPSQIEVLVELLSLVVLVSTVLPYLLVSIATLRVEGTSRTLGILLFVPGALLLALLADVVVLGASAIDGVIVGGGLALSMLAVGYDLRTADVPTDPTPADGDPIPG